MAQILTLLRPYQLSRLKPVHYVRRAAASSRKLTRYIEIIRSLGVHASLDGHEKRKLAIFNQLSFFQFLAGIILPFFALINNHGVTLNTWLFACLPSLAMAAVLIFNSLNKYESALFSYFIFYPLFICIVFLSRIDLGIELSFILCGILSVFFLKELGHMIFAISFSMVSYFVLFLIRRNYTFPPEPIDHLSYLLNEILMIILIFYALYLIVKENIGYEQSLLATNKSLQDKNLEIEKQQEVISTKAQLLEKQATKLRENDRVKNKLFSIISHDLKAPIYGLRNLFQQFAQQGISKKDFDDIMPEILNDLNYSTVLVENLLEWAKSQMQSSTVKPQELDLNHLVQDTVRLLQPQSRNKNIKIIVKTDMPVIAFADKDMIRLVLRNLLSNAIKFTPEKGEIVIGTSELLSCAEVYIKDSGRGISREEMKKINKNDFYSTHGTKNESGTGLGLMLCKEFLSKNESRLMIESEPGAGSTFSFTLPAA